MSVLVQSRIGETPVGPARSTIAVHRGTAALKLVRSPEFQASWRRLASACPWGTVHQDVPFATTWYECYQDVYDPLLVTETAPDGSLSGLLLLGVARVTGKLVQAGAEQAEYEVWLATPARGSAFLEAALTALAAAFPRGSLTFLFLPPNVPLALGATWRRRSFVYPMSRALMSTASDDKTDDALSKGKNRKRLNKLARLGALTFDRIVDPEEGARVLDELIPFFDTRQLAIGGSAAFRDDARKATFYRALMQHRDLMHVTALRLDGRVIAGHIGPVNRSQVILGLIAHSPFYAEHSVGVVHIRMLGGLLNEEGLNALDLTPGGQYKERFATTHDEVQIVTIFLSDADARAYGRKRSAIDFGKRFVSSERVKTLLAEYRMRRALVRVVDVPRKVVRRTAKALWNDVELRMYRMPAAAAPHPDAAPDLQRDCLDHLLHYAPVELHQPSAAAFVREALTRLGNGNHLYSRVEDGKLVHYGWLIERQQRAFLPDVSQSVELPDASAVLFDFYTHPNYRGRGYYFRSLRRMAHDAAQIPGTNWITIGVLADSAQSRRVIEKVGFEYWRSGFQRVRVGHVRRW